MRKSCGASKRKFRFSWAARAPQGSHLPSVRLQVAAVGPLYQHNQQELLVQMVDLELPADLDLVVDQEETTPKVVAQDHLLAVIPVALEVTTLVVEEVVLMIMEPLHQLTQMMVVPVVMEKHSLHIPDLYLHRCPVHGKVR